MGQITRATYIKLALVRMLESEKIFFTIVCHRVGPLGGLQPYYIMNCIMTIVSMYVSYHNIPVSMHPYNVIFFLDPNRIQTKMHL